MPRPFDSPISRLRVLPDEPDNVAGPRPRGSRRPHTDAKVAGVRRLIEQTTLTYGEIAAKTGVGRASICRWTRDGGWRRPPFAPRATDTVPSARASAKLKARTLAERLAALSERYICELEKSASVEPDKLSAALELLKMAKLAALPRHRPRKRHKVSVHSRAKVRSASSRTNGNPESFAHEPAAPGSPLARGRTDKSNESLRPIMQLHLAGVNIERAPPSAVADFISSHEPPRDFPELRPRGHRSKRNRDHARMLERIR